MLTSHSISPTAPRNRLLDALDSKDRALLVPHLSRVALAGGARLSSLSIDAPVVCFPLNLTVSLVEVMPDGSRFEIGLVGREGAIGWPTVMSAWSTPYDGIVQLDGGTALTIPTAVLPSLCAQSATLHATMLCFVQSFAVQMSHTIVANLRDGIERRLARWLLMLHDRVEGDLMYVTHGELASALHVRRASITDTLHILEGDRVLRCTRGQLVIRDRAQLIAIAGDSYGPAEASYRALIGDFGKSQGAS